MKRSYPSGNNGLISRNRELYNKYIYSYMYPYINNNHKRIA